MPYVVYILECADGTYYTGSAADLSQRVWQHETGASSSAYTFSRWPVKLVWASDECRRYSDALRWERQIKGWNRAKKQALIRGDLEGIHEIVKSEEEEENKIKKFLRAERSRSARSMKSLTLIEMKTCPSTAPPKNGGSAQGEEEN